jgi:hypothetical protein
VPALPPFESTAFAEWGGALLFRLFGSAAKS